MSHNMNPAQETIEQLERERDDLAMLVRRLVRRVRKDKPEDTVASQAMDYLTRHNLQGSILR